MDTNVTLEVNHHYQFLHKRKGDFTATVTELVPTPESDEVDTFLIRVQINTSAESGQSRLTNTFVRDSSGHKIPPAWTEKLLRPSLIEGVREVEG